MKNKILITGGAGFIGTELIKLINNKKNIVVVDKIRNKKTILKFKKLKIKYIQGNLINKEFSKKIYRNIKTIFHLAGTVKVPSTDINLDLSKEKRIFNEATKIMQNLIKYSDQKIKVIFPSTHLVFENCKKNKSIYDEKSEVLPYLAYSRSKHECEKLLINNKINFSIVRLGSVFGKTEDIKRMFNLPNLFPLRAKNNLDLKLFSRGIQIKSIISVKDVARAMLFLSQKNFKRKLYNLVSEHLTVKEIGNLCKKYNKKIKLIPTNDKIPYEGYYMNCSKIKKTGFRFKHNYKEFVKNFLLLS
tara:strand:+ start:2502 stop:3407 length:906 start_codon:yes stop_codon:yes gene_type:complete